MLRHSTIKELLYKADNVYQLNSVDDDAPYLKHCYKIQSTNASKTCMKDLVTLASTLDYKELYTSYVKHNKMHIGEKQLSCIEYTSEESYDDEYLFYKLSHGMEEGKPVFIYMDLHNYILEEYTNGTHEYLSHAVCYMLYPIITNAKTGHTTYNLYYVNSHGADMLQYKKYEYTFSKTRYKHVQIPANFRSMDMHVTSALADALNAYLTKYEFSSSVCYKPTKRYNYLSWNLQNGDNHGACYIYPYVIWNNILTKYSDHQIITHTKHHTYRTVMSIKNFLDTNDISSCIELIFMNYDTHIAQGFSELCGGRMESRIKHLNKTLESRKAHFIKKLLISVMESIEQ